MNVTLVIDTVHSKYEFDEPAKLMRRTRITPDAAELVNVETFDELHVSGVGKPMVIFHSRMSKVRTSTSVVRITDMKTGEQIDGH